jgi:hypothetical protein
MQQFHKSRKTFLAGFLTLLMAFLLFTSASKPSQPAEDIHYAKKAEASVQPSSIYAQLHLKELGLGETAFQLAIKGWEKLKNQGQISKSIISICDFTQSANNKRLYIIDLATGTLLFNTLVAHGKNTGEEFARYFSNQPSSLQSSLGFYVTKDAYLGKHGLGLRLQGKEPGFNDNAEDRAIVMHGAEYVCNKFIEQFGKLGRSFGCPAVPFEFHKEIINTIKDGSCLFIYYPDKKYLAASALLK